MFRQLVDHLENLASQAFSGRRLEHIRPALKPNQRSLEQSILHGNVETSFTEQKWNFAEVASIHSAGYTLSTNICQRSRKTFVTDVNILKFDLPKLSSKRLLLSSPSSFLKQNFQVHTQTNQRAPSGLQEPRAVTPCLYIQTGISSSISEMGFGLDPAALTSPTS